MGGWGHAFIGHEVRVPAAIWGAEYARSARRLWGLTEQTCRVSRFVPAKDGEGGAKAKGKARGKAKGKVAKGKGPPSFNHWEFEWTDPDGQRDSGTLDLKNLAAYLRKQAEHAASQAEGGEEGEGGSGSEASDGSSDDARGTKQDDSCEDEDEENAYVASSSEEEEEEEEEESSELSESSSASSDSDSDSGIDSDSDSSSDEVDRAEEESVGGASDKAGGGGKRSRGGPFRGGASGRYCLPSWTLEDRRLASRAVETVAAANSDASANPLLYANRYRQAAPHHEVPAYHGSCCIPHLVLILLLSSPTPDHGSCCIRHLVLISSPPPRVAAPPDRPLPHPGPPAATPRTARCRCLANCALGLPHEQHHFPVAKLASRTCIASAPVFGLPLRPLSSPPPPPFGDMARLAPGGRS